MAQWLGDDVASMLVLLFHYFATKNPGIEIGW